MSTQIRCALSGADKAAVLLLSLDAEKARQVLSDLGPEAAARLSERLAELGPLPAGARSEVLAEFEAALADAPPRQPRESPAEERLELSERAAQQGNRTTSQTTARSWRPFDFGSLPRASPPDARPKPSSRPRSLGPLADVPVLGRAVLARPSFSLRELSRLAVGDVILLDAAEAGVEVRFGDACALRGRPAAVSGRRAVVIEGRAR